jgi:hypothetical protein
MKGAKVSPTDGLQGLEGFLYVVDEPKLGGEEVPHNALPIYYASYPTEDYPTEEGTQDIGYPVEPSDVAIVRSEISVTAIDLDDDRARHKGAVLALRRQRSLARSGGGLGSPQSLACS